MAAVWVLAMAFGYNAHRLSLFVGDGLAGSPTATVLWTGRAVLLAFALLWAALYSRVRAVLPGPEWARGLLYGAGVWLVSALLLIPLAGWVNGTVDPGRAGWLGPVSVGYAGAGGLALSFAAHLVYGLILSAFSPAAAPGAEGGAPS